MDKLTTAIARGIGFLRQSQLPQGEFKVYASPDGSMADCRWDSSPFATALVLHAIGSLAHPQVREMTAKGLDFLLSEMEGPGLWRYWSSRNPQHGSLPPDLDVTCCVSYVLRQHGRAFPDNTALVLANRNEQGLFYTYVAPRPTTPAELRPEMGRRVSAEALLGLFAAGMLHEVDAVVNANVLLYLGESEPTRAAADHLIDTVRRGQEAACSRYYRDPLAFYYVLSRAYGAGAAALGTVREAVLERIVAARERALGSALAAALAACALLNFGQRAGPLPEMIACIQHAQREDGSWSRSPLYHGPAPYYGSEELTTALCLEALAGYSCSG